MATLRKAGPRRGPGAPGQQRLVSIIQLLQIPMSVTDSLRLCHTMLIVRRALTTPTALQLPHGMGCRGLLPGTTSVLQAERLSRSRNSKRHAPGPERRTEDVAQLITSIFLMCLNEQTFRARLAGGDGSICATLYGRGCVLHCAREGRSRCATVLCEHREVMALRVPTCLILGSSTGWMARQKGHREGPEDVRELGPACRCG